MQPISPATRATTAGQAQTRDHRGLFIAAERSGTAARDVALTVSLAACVACNRQQENTPAPASEPEAQNAAQPAQNAPTNTNMNPTPQPGQPNQAAQPSSTGQQANANKPAEHAAAQLVDKAAGTLRKMMAEPKLRKLLAKASGVFIVPTYVRAGAVVGGRGGEGVLLGHSQGKWSDPVFYNIGGISVGAQLGAEAGEIAMLLMDDRALGQFQGENDFSLNAGAKLTLTQYSGTGNTGVGKDDANVIFWSSTEGAFAGATLGATNLSWDEEENKSYYGKRATAQDILSGQVSDNKQGPLQQALSSL